MRDIPKLGYKGVDTSELSFDDYRVSGGNLVSGEEGKGFYQIMSGLELGRINVAARCLGVARAALEESTRYAKQRETFGKPIGEHQSVQIMLANMATQIQAAHLMVLHAAEKKDRGERADMEAGMAKLFASEIVFAGCHRRHAHPRRLRLHPGPDGGALFPRRAADDDRRGDQRDSAPGHCPPSAQQLPHRRLPVRVGVVGGLDLAYVFPGFEPVGHDEQYFENRRCNT